MQPIQSLLFFQKIIYFANFQIFWDTFLHFSIPSLKFSNVTQCQIRIKFYFDSHVCSLVKLIQKESYAPWHFLNFLFEPHGHGSLRPISLYCWPAPSLVVREGWGELFDAVIRSACLCTSERVLVLVCICSNFCKFSSAIRSIDSSISLKSRRPSFLYSTSGSR